MHVLYNEDPYIDVRDYDGQETNPGKTVHILFAYRGGIGTGRAGSFNIFLYDRSDVATDGTPDAPEANLPAVFGVTPAVPRAGRPNLSIPQTDILNAGGLSVAFTQYWCLGSGKRTGREVSRSLHR